jgi:uncharacterized protein (DUF1697 family)
MPTHAAFLRAVNLGSTRKASKEQLHAAFEAAGFEDVATFRTSGNVVFSAKGSVEAIRDAIEKALKAELGFEVPTFVRTASQLQAIAAREPFPPRAVAKTEGRLQVALLAAKPKAAERKAALELAGEEDLLELDGTELYWLPRAGVSTSPFGMKAVDSSLGLNTIRTQGTLRALLEKFV